MTFKLRYKSLGLRTILVEWPNEINKNILEDVLILKRRIENSYIKEVVQVNSSYSSLIVFYDKNETDPRQRIATIDKIYIVKNNAASRVSVLWKIPVCYNPCFGVDLDTISVKKEVSKSEIIRCHHQAVYIVYFIGFLPGFLYLGGLDESLVMPRKLTPRLQVEKGAVAIGGNQTGVYPNKSPGGWNIIGNSPINFFDVSKETPCFAKPGDYIKFYPVSLKTHQDIKTLVEAGVYQIESEEKDD